MGLGRNAKCPTFSATSQCGRDGRPRGSAQGLRPLAQNDTVWQKPTNAISSTTCSTLKVVESAPPRQANVHCMMRP